MTTYDNLRKMMLRLLKDPSGKTADADISLDAIQAGHKAILPWVPKFAVATLTSPNGDGLLELPADTYQVDAVQDLRTNVFLPKATLAPRLTRNTQAGIITPDWVEYPSGSISLSELVDSDVQFQVFYRAYWGVPTSGSEAGYIIEAPGISHTGIVFYACSHVLIPRAVSSSGIRQFNTRVDSGNPEDNPMEQSSDYFRRLFYLEMKMMPTYTKGVQV